MYIYTATLLYIRMYYNIPFTLENKAGLHLQGKMKIKQTGTPRNTMPKAANESTGASMSGRRTRNIAASNMSIGIGRNTYV